jgi:lipid A 3-O-deacylase
MTFLPAKTLLALAAMLAAALPSTAAGVSADSVSLEIGSGRKVQMARVAAQSRWDKRWFQSNGTHVGGHWDLSLSQWRGSAYQNVQGQDIHIVDIGLTPVFRLQADDLKGWYAEGAIGVHLLSKLYDNNSDYLSTRFQFGDHIGGGYVFNNGWEAALLIQHFSNGGIKRPNSGVNYLVFKVARAF